MRIDYDKVSRALYIKIREGTYSHSEDFSEKADVYLDVDAEGNVLGLEALSFDDLTQAAEEHDGKLEIPNYWTTSDNNFPQQEVLLAALEALPPRRQEVLKLRFTEGLTQSEIARLQGTSAAEISEVTRSALRDLKEALKPEFGNEENDASLKEALTLIAS